MSGGSLTVVGTGIQLGAHVTAEARAYIEVADELLHIVTEPATRAWLHAINRRARSLHRIYTSGRDRTAIYEEIVDEILASVRRGGNVCAAFYGHPAVFVYPSHEAVRRARAEGFAARILPAVSAEDCLFADLEVDPVIGCQSYEATDFLLYGRGVDTTAALILWQVTLIGQRHSLEEPFLPGLQLLAERLFDDYPREHAVALYEAAVYPVMEPAIEWRALHDLASPPVPPLATLYVPPVSQPTADGGMADRLRLLGVDRDAV